MGEAMGGRRGTTGTGGWACLKSESDGRLLRERGVSVERAKNEGNGRFVCTRRLTRNQVIHLGRRLRKAEGVTRTGGRYNVLSIKEVRSQGVPEGGKDRGDDGFF